MVGAVLPEVKFSELLEVGQPDAFPSKPARSVHFPLMLRDSLSIATVSRVTSRKTHLFSSWHQESYPNCIVYE